MHPNTRFYIENIDKNPDQVIERIYNATASDETTQVALPNPRTVLRYRFKRRVMYFKATAATPHVSILSKLVRIGLVYVYPYPHSNCSELCSVYISPSLM